ncbi:MAG: amidohydrolase family protein [Actinobacteria bacterium]|nr:amidohydrolase family protein [Actinomycetota bacterium]
MADAVLDLLARTDGDSRRRILVRGGYVLSMDADVGELVGDVLIEGSMIAAVGPELGAAGGGFDGIEVDAKGAVVLPGLVDSHFHGWQAALGGLVPDVTLPEYMATVHGAYFGAPGPPGLAACYAPEDMRIGNLVSSLRMLDSGVTCFVDNCHNARTPEHSDAAVEGLREARIRAVHAVGAPVDGTRTDDWLADVLRLRDESFGGGEELLTLRLFGAPESGLWEFAREHGFWTSTETGAWVEADLRRLFEAGLIGSDHTFNHASGLSAEIWRRLGEQGAAVNVCARSDTTYLVADAIPPLAEALAAGVPVGLSMDTEVGYGIDMFAEMRTLLHLARGRSAPVVPGEQATPQLVDAPAILALATVGGAANAGLAGRIGSLTPGRAADLIVLRPGRLSLDPPGNLAATVVSYATPSDVEAVFVAGTARKWAGELTGQDVSRALARLEDSRGRLLAEFGAALDPFRARFWE